jgi:transcriptional regulator with XRE-family HTH domain
MGPTPKPTKRNALVAARKAAGFTQEELAARLGVERSTVYRWESGETTPLPMLRPGLARLLRLDNDQLAALLGESGDEAAHLDAETDAAPAVSSESTPLSTIAGTLDDLATLDVAYHHILTAIRGLPEFDTELHTEVLQRTRQISKTIEHRIAEDQLFELRAREDFERRYVDQVISALGRMELFGIGRGRTHSLDRAYVNLAVSRSEPVWSVEDDDLSGAGLDVASAFLEHPRVFLRGGAGAGKSTLLQWLAVSACRPTSPTTTAWGRMVPFLVQLRRFRPSELPEPEAFPKTVAAAITDEMPAGWAHYKLRSGDAVLLVDGVDEIEHSRRNEVRDWLRGLVSAFPRARIVVSGRPFAVTDSWLTELGFTNFDLLPLSSRGIRDFLRAWHEAAREECPIDDGRREYLEACESGLAEQLAARAELRTIAGTPLLCGLLCALYEDRNMHLPRDRKGLYDAALDLLLVKWDEQRHVDDMTGWPRLGKEGQITLLQRFAYWLVRHDRLVVFREEAVTRFEHAMRGLRGPDLEPELVLQRTLERTGLLREPHPGEVQFVHRVFRDYLAAKEVVDAGDLDLLVEHAHLESWYDVLVNAVAHARPKERDPMLNKLLNGNKASRQDPRLRDRLRLVAAACLEQAEVLGTDEIRDKVRQAAARLIPPRSFEDADLLAKAGPLVLELLPGVNEVPAEQAPYVIRTAAMIGGEGMWDKLAGFVPAGEAMVIDELLRAWRKAEDPEHYARTVLADVDFGAMRLEVRGSHRVRCLPYMTKLTNVICYGAFGPLEPVAAMPRLRKLELVQNDSIRDLRPLARCRTLRTLIIKGGTFVRDLSPLGDTAIEELGLYWTATDLHTLRAPSLRILHISDRRIADGLHKLPDDLPIRQLYLYNHPDSRSLLGVQRWQHLQHVYLRAMPRPDELHALAQLPDLQQVTIAEPKPGTDLTPLTALTQLTRLDFDGVPDAGIETIHADARRVPHLDVYINGKPLQPPALHR